MLLSSKREIPITVTLAFLPWILVVFFTAGTWAALNCLAYGITVAAAGYFLIGIALPSVQRIQVMVLSPAVGVLLLSSLTAMWVRLGFPLIWVSVLWLGLGAAGAVCLWRDRNQWAHGFVAYGGALVLLSALICAVYLLPGARNDAVHRHDGSFSWLYVDTQFNYSMAAAVKSGGSPPKEPGTATVELLYHFGGYAPAAAISRIDGLDLGDAYARVARGVSLWALMLSCFGLGTLLSLKANGREFGGIMSAGGLFFYGSLLAMFTDERNSSSYVTGAIFFNLPKAMVGHDGGPFSHLILGHSELHALLAITAIMGLCLVHRDRGGVTWREVVLLVLPALAVAMHSVAGLYCIGVVAILTFWGRLGLLRSWVMLAVMFCVFLAAWSVMGYSHAPDAVRATIKPELDRQWWTVAAAFTIGLGFRIVGFRWISRPWSNPLSALVLATVVGLVAFFLLYHLKGGEEIYGVYFLQSVFSIFAFSRLTPGFWRSSERSQWVEEWLRPAQKGTFVIAISGALIGIVGYATHGSAGIESFRTLIPVFFLLSMLLAGILILMKRSPEFSNGASMLIMSVLLLGFLAWIPPWLNFGMGRMKMDVTLTPGEVRGLHRLADLAAPGERFATNKHDVDGLATNRHRSYGYAALSECPVLLEGVQYHTPAELPWFQTLVRENDQMFTTADPQTVRDIAKAWHVRWLVARPGTDISLPKPLPPWLVEEHDSGTLKIYRID